MTSAAAFADRVAIVTGGASGIGYATAQRLLGQGANLAIFDIDGADRAAGNLDPDRALGLAIDVTDAAAVADGVRQVADTFGTVDILVNNAFARAEDDENAWQHEIDVILGGAFKTCRAVLPVMAAAGRGAIVNVSSVNAHAMFGSEGYSAAKAGAESLTRSIAVRWGPRGVRANAVVPGTIRTPAWDDRADSLETIATWYPLKRVGEPEDVAAAICFLASDDAAWISGTTLFVDGGLMASPPLRVGRADNSQQ